MSQSILNRHQATIDNQEKRKAESQPSGVTMSENTQKEMEIENQTSQLP